MFDWNDLKPFLAVARGGSTLAASRTLGVNQTTVARRVEGLEQALALKLFERSQGGSRLTEAGRDLVDGAEAVERAAREFEIRAQAHQRGLAGVIRVTCMEIVANMTLTPAIAEFRRQYPEVQVDLVATDEMLDIEGGEADVAIRTGVTLPESDLVARKLVDYAFRLYCSRDYAARRGVPATPEALAEHDLVGGALTGDPMLDRMPGLVWMYAQAGGKAPVARCSTLTNLVHAVRAGIGVSALPAILGDADPDLVRCSKIIGPATSTAWIVTRKDLKATPRVRAFLDFVVPYVQQDARRREAQVRAMREQARGGSAQQAASKS